MIIRPFVDDRHVIITASGKKLDPNIAECRRDIYITSLPNLSFDESWEGIQTSHVVVTVVNRSFIKGDLLFPETKGADWVFLKSVYVFTTNVHLTTDVQSAFKDMNLYPQTEMSTGYYGRDEQVFDLGTNFTDLDMMSARGVNMNVYTRPMAMPRGLKVIDPRYYSDREHHQNVMRFPDDFLPQLSYRGSDLIDGNTLFHVAKNVPELRVENEMGQPLGMAIPTNYNQTLVIRSFWMSDTMFELLHLPSFGIFDEMIFIFDSEEGVHFPKIHSPSGLPDEFLKMRTKQFADEAKMVLAKLEKKLGKIRVFYHRMDAMDRIRIIFKENILEGEGNSMSYRIFRSDAIDELLLSTRALR